jgi:hypothetical protein
MVSDPNIIRPRLGRGDFQFLDSAIWADRDVAGCSQSHLPNPVKPDPHSGLKPDPESSRSRTLNPVIPDPPFSERCDAGIFLLLDHPLLSQH